MVISNKKIKKMTDLLELSKQVPNLKIEISANELLDAMRSIVEEIVERYENVEQPEQYLTPKITAERLDVTLGTLWRWSKENYLNHVAIGGKRRYKLSDIERILKV
jgi:DNA-binding transcriptional MerR regulator